MKLNSSPEAVPPIEAKATLRELATEPVLVRTMAAVSLPSVATGSLVMIDTLTVCSPVKSAAVISEFTARGVEKTGRRAYPGNSAASARSPLSRFVMR